MPSFCKLNLFLMPPINLPLQDCYSSPTYFLFLGIILFLLKIDSSRSPEKNSKSGYSFSHETRERNLYHLFQKNQADVIETFLYQRVCFEVELIFLSPLYF